MKMAKMERSTLKRGNAQKPQNIVPVRKERLAGVPFQGPRAQVMPATVWTRGMIT